MKALIRSLRSAQLSRSSDLLANRQVRVESGQRFLSWLQLALHINRQPPLMLFGQTGLGHCPSRISLPDRVVPKGQTTSGG